MTAIQIADSFDSFAIDHTPDGWLAVQQKQLTEAALMLRKQHEAIVKLRAALENARIQYDYHGNPMDDCDRMVIAALAATETLT